MPSRLSLDYQAFDDDVQLPSSTRKVVGHVLLTNTVEEFRNLDRKALMNKLGDEVRLFHFATRSTTFFISDLDGNRSALVDARTFGSQSIHSHSFCRKLSRAD